jgi:hypothetical protein
MTKYEEIRKLKSLFDVESSLDTQIYELAGYDLIEDIAEDMFQLKEEMNKRLNKRIKELELNGAIGVKPIDTSHLNDDDFGAYIREEMSEADVMDYDGMGNHKR